MSKTIKLNEEFDKFMTKIKEGANFAFMRNADGELAIMQGRAVSAQEGNWKSPDYVSKLGESIQESLNIVDKRVYYAISCPCCDRAAYYWYRSRIPSSNITFANLWINSNYNRFKIEFPKINREAILIANYRAEGKRIGNLNILKHYKISDDCFSFWENEAERMLNEIKEDYGKCNNLLYVVSAGPMSGPIIANLFANNPENCYIDFGSSIDIYYREGITRPYMIKGNVYAERNCWMFDPRKVNFDVTAVCTLYKRPESLIKQLEALNSQSLKPKEIMLFQDAIAEGYKVELLDSIMKRFDNIKISDENVGVWGRFDFARQAKYPYVCLFDDDTIPGMRWLENCHYHMQRKNAVYGAIGIVMTKVAGYPEKDYFRVGWAEPYSKVAEVDFVGHSWFVKKEYLDYMYENTEEFQKYKYVAEDMCLSAQCQKHGIPTFVPPQPYSDQELWGSHLLWGRKLGNSVEALSLNKTNYTAMKKAISQFEMNGWKPLCFTNEAKIKKLRQAIKHEKVKNDSRLFVKRVKNKIIN